MSRLSNQTIERYYFELFQSHYEVPDGDLVFTDKPDVIVRGTRTIGIEVATSIFPAAQIRRANKCSVRVGSHAWTRSALHRASGGRHIEFSVGFNPKYQIQSLSQLCWRWPLWQRR